MDWNELIYFYYATFGLTSLNPNVLHGNYKNDIYMPSDGYFFSDDFYTEMSFNSLSLSNYLVTRTIVLK